MAFQKISKYRREDISDLTQQIQEFEYRKAITLTLFERQFSKKSFEERRSLFLQLENADWDFTEGALNGRDSIAAFKEIKKIGLSKGQTKALMYAYWFSLPKEREAFKKHIIGGVIETRSAIRQQRPNTGFQKVSTAVLGERLYSAQNYFAWGNPLTLLAKEEKQINQEAVVQVIKNAQTETGKNGLTAGIHTLASGLMPFFFQKEGNEILSEDKGLSAQTIQSIVHKGNILEPTLKNFAWLYLTQCKFYQDLEVREFLRKQPQKPQQMLLSLSFDRTRDE